MGPQQHAEIVASIAADIVTSAPFESYADAVGTSLEDAYAVQDSVVEYLTENGPRGPVIGYKIAANSTKALAAMGLTEPLSGRIFADQCVSGAADLRTKPFRTRAFEPEIAALIGSDIPPRHYDRNDISPYVSRLVPAFEVLDLREAKPSPQTIKLAVAQNINNEGAVLGGPGLPPAGVIPENLRARITFNDTEMADVTGGAPQHPLDAVACLAGHLSARGQTLRAGMVVLCGTHTPILFPEGPGRLVLQIEGLGEAIADIG